MANRNISALVQIGATMSSSVGAVFGGMKKRMDELGGSLAKLKKQSGDITKLQAAQGKLAEAKAKGSATAVARYSAQVEKLSHSLEEAGVDTSQLAKEQARLAQSIGKVEQQLGRFKSIGSVFDRLKSGAKGLGDAFGGLKEKLGAAFTRLGIVTGVLGGAAAGVGYLTAEFIDQGDALADQAEGLNMSTRALQTWQFAAGTVGIESEKLGSILSKLQSKITDGSDKTKEAFSALGISYSKLKRMSPEQQLTHITEAFSRLPDSVNKTALANEIFGKSGYKLLPVLNAGAAGLKDIYEEAKRTGYILSDDTNDAVNKADAAFNQLKLQLTGFKNQALAPLLPVFTDLVGKLGQIITEHGPKLTAWVQTAGKSFMEGLAPAIGSFVTNDLPPLVDNIGKIVSGLTSMASWLADLVGGWDKLAIGLVALNFAPVIASVVSLGATMWTLAGATIAAVGPWGLLAAGIVAVGAVIYKFKDEIVGLIDAAIDPLLDKLKAIGAWFANTKLGKMFGLDKYNLDGTPQVEKPAGPFERKSTDEEREDLLKQIMPPSQMPQPTAQLMPTEDMPGAGTTNNVKQDFQINVTAPSQNPADIAAQVKSAIKNLPLYDSTGVLAPQ
jgi:hypothetical protein